MPRSRFATLFFPVAVLLVSMASIQGGAALAKSLFPVLGAQGVTAMRLLFAAIIIIAMALDMCAFPLSRRNVVLAQSCVARLQPAEEEAADEPAVVEKAGACQ